MIPRPLFAVGRGPLKGHRLHDIHDSGEVECAKFSYHIEPSSY